MNSIKLITVAALLLGVGCTRPADPSITAVTPGDPSVRPTDAAIGPAVTRPETAELAHAPALIPHTLVEVWEGTLVDDELPATWQPILVKTLPDPTGVQVAAMPISDPAIAAETWRRTARWWSAGATYRWNEIARLLTAKHGLNSSNSSRLFAALAVAQHDAAWHARRQSIAAGQTSPNDAQIAEEGVGNIERRNQFAVEAAIGTASSTVLEHFFVLESRFLTQNRIAHLRTREWMGANTAAATEAGSRIGKAVADETLAYILKDGADQAGAPYVLEEPGKWFNGYQTLPGWKNVKPWVMERADQFRAPEPPALNGEEMRKAVAEIRAFSDYQSAEQLSIASFWNLPVGGVSVPGMWDQLALQRSHAEHWGEMKTARLLALMNMAMFDASIACWETKYHYLVKRPTMVDDMIQLPLGLPAHPSYSSGHSAFSGAAAEMLGAFFPADRAHFDALAAEASASRWYGGIHYRFDGDLGLVQGREVARFVLSHHPF